MPNKILDQIFNRISDDNPTVKDININIKKGETIALVEESEVENQQSEIYRWSFRTKDGLIGSMKIEIYHLI